LDISKTRILPAISLIIILLVVSLSVEPWAIGQEKARAINAEIVSKRYSSGLFPSIGSYVEYDMKLNNVGSEPISNQSLWVLLTSENNKTRSYATYTILLIEPQASKTLHLGPFKMQEEGNHELFVGMQGVAFEYRPDLFSVYRQDIIGSISAGIVLIIAGLVIVSFSMYRKHKSRIA
jgi:hypothetical protein